MCTCVSSKITDLYINALFTLVIICSFKLNRWYWQTNICHDKTASGTSELELDHHVTLRCFKKPTSTICCSSCVNATRDARGLTAQSQSVTLVSGAWSWGLICMSISNSSTNIQKNKCQGENFYQKNIYLRKQMEGNIILELDINMRNENKCHFFMDY